MKRVFEFVGLFVLILGIVLVLLSSRNINSPVSDFEIKYDECLNMQQAVFHLEAVQMNDLELCDNSFDPEMCEARLIGNSSFCELYESPKKDYCRGTINQNVDFCGVSTTCKAEVLKDPSLCANRSFEDSGFSDKDCRILAGEKYIPEEFCYDDTWSEMAFFKYDSSLCLNILDNKTRIDCEARAGK